MTRLRGKFLFAGACNSSTSRRFSELIFSHFFSLFFLFHDSFSWRVIHKVQENTVVWRVHDYCHIVSVGSTMTSVSLFRSWRANRFCLVMFGGVGLQRHWNGCLLPLFCSYFMRMGDCRWVILLVCCSIHTTLPDIQLILLPGRNPLPENPNHT